jgi:hypothetical protein
MDPLELSSMKQGNGDGDEFFAQETSSSTWGTWLRIEPHS